eukprot:5638086-Pleurochrysis_carterae.AAC.3
MRGYPSWACAGSEWFRRVIDGEAGRGRRFIRIGYQKADEGTVTVWHLMRYAGPAAGEATVPRMVFVYWRGTLASGSGEMKNDPPRLWVLKDGTAAGKAVAGVCSALAGVERVVSPAARQAALESFETRVWAR